jgi:hypothetical protein
LSAHECGASGAVAVFGWNADDAVVEHV